jgi:amino acid transporter
MSEEIVSGGTVNDSQQHGIPLSTEKSRLAHPPRVIGFTDLVLFYVVTGISLRWIATAASAGPSAITIWIGAWLCFYIPLVLSVVELSSRYPDEGGLYVWAKRGYGDFAGFIFPPFSISQPAMLFISADPTGPIFPAAPVTTSCFPWLRWG